ncbi:MAG: Crp/Fnr family transcriptional regulator [Deltaproteobacteria bacterium]
MYHRGETVFLGDEESLQMYIILKGRVKVVENSPDGRERIMAIRHSGDYFGDMGLLDGKTDYATVIAMQPSKMLLITKGVFDDFFLKNSAALQSMIMLLCGRLRESWLFQTIIGTNDAESKIRVTLARYGKTLGIKDRSGVIINTVLTHQSIADRVLITRETATRVLKRLRDQNEIEMVGRHIKLLDTFFYKNKQCELYQTLKAMENSP